MKSLTKIMAAIILTALACTTAFAAEKPIEFKTFKNVTVGTTELKPGEYAVAVEKTGADAKVTFLKNKKTVATAEGKYVENKNLGFGFAVITEGPAVKQLQGDKLSGTIELK
jgi:hypothetical protein